MVFLAKASQDGGIEFESDYTRAHFKQWLKDHPVHPLRIDTPKKVSKNLRGYYYAAVIPTVKFTIPQWEHLTSEEIHNILKKQFAYFEAWNDITKRTERFSHTVMSDESNTKRAMEFIETIGKWLGEDYHIELPDPSTFTNYRDSAPMISE